MHIILQVEHILSNLRPVFSLHATYEWFVILIWGILYRFTDTRRTEEAYFS